MRTLTLSLLALGVAGALTVTPAFADGSGWAGPYIGAQIGGAWGTENDNGSDVLNVPADSFSLSGMTGGVYAGYDWDVGPGIFGLEGDLNLTNLGGNADVPGVEGNLGFKSDWQGAIKARYGLPFDQFLLYATGGVVWAHGTENFSQTEPYDYSGSDSATHTGWLIGIGGEYKLTDNLSLRGEIDYTSFGNRPYSGIDPEYSDGTLQAGFNQTTAQVGLSFHF